MKTTRPDSALERLLLALEHELMEATDEEILEAARDLGMNPGMKGSAAFIGVTMVVRWRVWGHAPSWIKGAAEHESGTPRRRPKGETPTSE
jgi:hypothetical protein